MQVGLNFKGNEGGKRGLTQQPEGFRTNVYPFHKSSVKAPLESQILEYSMYEPCLDRDKYMSRKGDK